ncbi:hypothetical protein [Sphingomonas sp. AX6]|uniref:hypothetical protein n=1 Tax=Sphingomonas sp. AX6 TaxID=2653171 RepID=UPI0012F2FDA4|nr:hypothetical protein [Sphingomonas sp. AX6]VXC72475.1 conserved membrane hypothetical protein [Sphingomonas sp. AX6]
MRWVRSDGQWVPQAEPAIDGRSDRGVDPTSNGPDRDLAGLEPFQGLKRRWPTVLGSVVSIAMVAVLAYELFDGGLADLFRTLPNNPAFYLAFLAMYAAPVFFDWIIFRRLWRIPTSGIGALVKKRIANDVVLGYSGEAYFYAWARQRMRMITAPFGAVKDVSILSAQAGNLLTLIAMAVALPFASGVLTPEELRGVGWAAAITVAISLPFILFSKRVYSLPGGQLWWVFGVHCLRILAGSFALAWAWHFAMPGVAFTTWAFLVAIRLLVTRLPFVPNKDLLFANIAIILIGQGTDMSELMALTAAMALLLHVALIGAFGFLALARKTDDRQDQLVGA